MKTTVKWGIFALLPLFFFSCNDDTAFFNTIQPQGDQIFVQSDSFHITMAAQKIDRIPARITTDTILLGAYTDKLIGNTTAEILTQLTNPAARTLPSVLDTIYLNLELYYSNFIASGDSTISLTVYRMNKKTFDYRGEYFSDIDPNDYCDKTDILAAATFNVGKTLQVNGERVLFIPLKKALLDQLLAESPAVFASEAAFQEFFKGIYIEVNAGNAMCTLSQVNMRLGYRHKNSVGEPMDEAMNFPANKEVRQINRIVHEYAGGQIPVSDTAVFVASPAAIHATVDIPLQRIKEYYGIKIDPKTGFPVLENGQRMNVNLARLTLEIADDTIAANQVSTLKYPPYLLLIKESQAEDFFKTPHTYDGRTSIVAAYGSRAYTFDLSSYFINELKKEQVDETDRLVLIPVQIDSYSMVKYENRLLAAPLRSQGNAAQPTKLNLVISGF